MELAAIWNQVDHALGKQDEIKLVVNKNFCGECNGVKVYTPEGLPVCSSCGLVEDRFIDESPEWTSGVSEDGRTNDPSRCGNPNSNPELFSQSWGKGTVMATTSSSKYELKRMAKMMYKKFDDSKLTRGAVRTGIKGNCVLYACSLSKVPRTTKEIADMFGIQSKDMSRTTQMFKETIMGKTEKNYMTKPCDVVHRLLGNFNAGQVYRPVCTKMCSEIEDCVELMSKTPNSIASAVILIALKGVHTKSEICSTCGVSVPTVNKIETIIKKHLEAKGVKY